MSLLAQELHIVDVVEHEDLLLEDLVVLQEGLNAKHSLRDERLQPEPHFAQLATVDDVEIGLAALQSLFHVA